MTFQTKELSPVHFLPNGELSIRNPRNCANTNDYCQPAKRDSNAVFQVDLSEFSGIELATDGTFDTACGVTWTCGGDWNIAAGLATVLSAAGANVLDEEIVATTDVYYMVVFDLLTVASGSIAITINGGNPVLHSVGGLGKIAIVKAGNSNTRLAFTATLVSDFSIDNVSVMELSNISFEVRNITTDTVVFTETDGTSVTYHPTFPTAKVDFPWSNIPDDGKYEICLFGGNELLTNPDFVDASGWTISGFSKWSLGGGFAAYDSGGFPSSVADREMIQEITVPKGVCFQFKVIMAGLMSGSLAVQFDGSTLTGSPITADGTTFFSIDNREGKFDVTGDLRFLGSDGPVGEFKLDFAGVSTKICSECFCVAEDFEWAFEFEWDNQNGFNNRNAYGFDYETLNMVHFMLIQGRLGGGNPTSLINSVTLQSEGTVRRNKERIRISQTFFTEGTKPVPEYITNAFFAAFKHNRALINGVAYVSLAEQLQPLLGNDDLVANFQSPVFKQGQNFTLNCG